MIEFRFKSDTVIQPETWKRLHEDVAAVWSVFGPLAGVFIGAYIAGRNQRDRWVADNKRAEYRELLTTLAESFTKIVRLRGHGVAAGPEEERTLMNLELRTNTVILDRIFIADEVEYMELLNRWNHALQDYDKTLDRSAFATAFSRIRNDVIQSAATIMKKGLFF